MARTATHEELEQRIKRLKKEVLELKRLEKAGKESESRVPDFLKTNEERFRTLFNFFPQPIAVTELDSGEVLDVNDMFCEVSHLTRDEVIGQTSVELGWWTAKDRKRFAQDLKNSGEIQAAEHNYPIRDGSIRSALRFSKIIEFVGKTLVLSVLVDITERKRAEEALQEREERLRFCLEGSGDGTWEGDLRTSKIYLSKRIKEMWGIDQKKGKIQRSDLMDSIHPDYLEYLDKTMMGVREGRTEQYTVEYPIKVDGHWKWMLSRGKVITRTKAGKPERIFGTVSDITERKLSEEALKQREKELEIKSTNLEEMNAALKVLLKNREEDKKELEEKLLLNIRQLGLPYLEKLKQTDVSEKQKTYLGILESNLSDIISPFLLTLSSKYSDLTPTEIQVAHLVREGKRTKEIADFLHSSIKTVEVHRKNIRTKLGILNKKTNLRTHLLSFQ